MTELQAGAVPREAPRLPLSRFAPRALRYALLPFAVNIVGNLLGFLLEHLMVISTSDLTYYFAWGSYIWFFIAARLVVVASVIYAFYNAFRALEEIRGGTLSGRGRAVFAIALGVVHLVLVAVSVGSLVGNVILGVVGGV